MSDLSPEAVAARLEALRRLSLAPRVEPRKAPEPIDMGPAAVARRLEELRELWRLTQVLHGARIQVG